MKDITRVELSHRGEVLHTFFPEEGRPKNYPVNRALVKLQDIQPFSAKFACQHEGYKVTSFFSDDTTESVI